MGLGWKLYGSTVVATVDASLFTEVTLGSATAPGFVLMAGIACASPACIWDSNGVMERYMPSQKVTVVYQFTLSYALQARVGAPE